MFFFENVLVFGFCSHGWSRFWHVHPLRCALKSVEILGGKFVSSVEPEAKARLKIDEMLGGAGWTIQDRDEFDRTASLGVAVREFALPNGEADYLLFVAGKAAGVIEAKPAGVTLSGVSEQAAKYMAATA